VTFQGMRFSRKKGKLEKVWTAASHSNHARKNLEGRVKEKGIFKARNTTEKKSAFDKEKKKAGNHKKSKTGEQTHGMMQQKRETENLGSKVSYLQFQALN